MHEHACWGAIVFEVDEWPSLMCVQLQVGAGWKVSQNRGVLGENCGDAEK